MIGCERVAACQCIASPAGASVGSLDGPGQPASVATNGFRARSPEIDPAWVAGCSGVPRMRV
jgi:hypothetical protein